ncbi:response regulator [Sporosarcina sp. FA9]|uniref:response regulator n=1 Tax=Sporosarcina sp. FA9 TaxID=3413030 RepID=UPI003F654F72
MEDDFRVADINKKFTERLEGFEVCGIASTIKEAKEKLLTYKPDLVFLDVYFPDGNGIDMLWHIRNHHRSTDVILITAAKEIETVQEAIRGGVIDYIIKPVLFDRFEKTLAKYIKNRLQMTTIDDVDQEDVDQLLHNKRKELTYEQNIPKGIDPLTLKKIKGEINTFKEQGVTAEDFGKHVGMSRTTARRYLEYMVSIGSITAELAYGQVGRPERLYRLNEE